MKTIVNISLIIAAISLIVGIISRVAGQAVGPMALQPHVFLQFTNTCLLAAIALTVLRLAK